MQCSRFDKADHDSMQSLIVWQAVHVALPTHKGGEQRSTDKSNKQLFYIMVVVKSRLIDPQNVQKHNSKSAYTKLCKQILC